MRISRRRFLQGSAAAGASLFFVSIGAGGRIVRAAPRVALSEARLAPADIPKFVTPLLVPPVMPRAGVLRNRASKPIDYYEISVRQFAQQILPAGMPATTVWGFGATARDRRGLLLHNAPSSTIEARWERPVRIRWTNDLVDENGEFLPHLLPVDPTIHWANPGGGVEGRDSRPTFTSVPGPYVGPVPFVAHLHGAVGVGDESDGYPEAWFLPAATDIPSGFATEGTWYDFFRAKAASKFGTTWGPGSATFQYPNLNRASTLWFHDHTLGMTRLNVYAGPAGFYLLRGGPDDMILDSRTGAPASLPGPAPREGDRFPSNKPYREIPIAIQDRSFYVDGSLFYPDTRAYFDEIVGPFEGEEDEDGEPAEMGTFPPIWNPEFFADAIIVNGNTWPHQVVEQCRYRLRALNGCQSRFLILDFADIPGVEVWQIGNEGGFLPAPVDISGDHAGRVLLGLAERADLIVDFTKVPVGAHVLRNVGPDMPFGGGSPGVDFDPAAPDATGLVMEFRVVPATTADTSTPPAHLQLPAIAPLPAAVRSRPLALMEMAGIGHDAEGHEVEGPVAAMLGTATDGTPEMKGWMDAITEDPSPGDTEIWEFFNTTADAHPMHVHEVTFEVVDRQALAVDDEEVVTPFELVGDPTPPEAWEAGRKDTVIAYPGQVTRIKATFANAGRFVWHCHIVEHEDNEMMRPFRVGEPQEGEPGSM